MNYVDFENINLTHRAWGKNMLWADHVEACDLLFASNFVWREAYNVEIANVCDCMVVRYSDENQKWCTFPVGAGDKKKAIELLMKQCIADGTKLGFYPLEKEQKELLEKWFGGRFIVTADEDTFDYVYIREELSGLKGRKFQAKRNHIHRFCDGGDWQYVSFNCNNMVEFNQLMDGCLELENEWIAGKISLNPMLKEELDFERRAIEDSFKYFHELELVGGAIVRESKVIAFAIGELINKDMMVVHFEKARSDVQGAFAIINQQFALNECEGCVYINREDDTGDFGLRKAKRSYHPIRMVEKYIGLESDVVFATKSSKNDIESLWQEAFGDEKEYIDFYMNNRFMDELMLVIYEDGKLVSMASFLDCAIEVDVEKKNVPAKYVYAVATKKEFRGKKYASRIIKFAQSFFGKPLILEPADDKLRKYYENLGFVSFGKEQKWCVDNSLIGAENVFDDKELSIVTPSEFKRIRDSHFARQGYVKWNEEAIAYALEENEFCEGKAVGVNEDDYVMYRIEDDVLRIVESTLSRERTQLFTKSLLIKYNMSKAVYERAQGMILWDENSCCNYRSLDISNGYLNLTLC